jgi:hypothetical protein
MSTAELGISLAEMIRQTNPRHPLHQANLEEVFNLVARDFYERVPITATSHPKDEAALLARHMNRVTDTAFQKWKAPHRIRRLEEWVADKASQLLPHEFMFKILRSGKLEESYQIDPKTAGSSPPRREPPHVRPWMGRYAGNMYAYHCISGDVKNVHTVRTGSIHDGASRVVHQHHCENSSRFFPNWWRHRRRLPHPLSHAASGLAARHVPSWDTLPDQRLDDQLWVVLRSRTQRENYLGQAWRQHAEVHHRI